MTVWLPQDYEARGEQDADRVTASPEDLAAEYRHGAETAYWITTLAAGGLWASATLVADDEVKYDHYVPSKWNTVTWGIYSAEYAPVMRVKSGEVVKIDIANPAGMNRLDPKKFLAENIGKPQ